MALAHADYPGMTVAQFLTWHEGQEEKYELIDGMPVLKFFDPATGMTGASNFHSGITGNAFGSLYAQLRGRPCRAHHSDAAVNTVGDQVRYPDVAVDCGRSYGPDDYLLADPRVVIEVESRSTSRTDATTKLAEYQAVASIAHVLIVSAAHILVVHHRRVSADGWRMERHTTLDAVLDFPEIEARLPLAELYEGFDLEPGTSLNLMDHPTAAERNAL